MRSTYRYLAGVILALGLAGCRIEVYDGLSQRDANEMTALLLTAGVDAERTSQKDGTFTVMVAEEDFARAVTLIGRSGLPKPQFATIVDVLSDDRLIASPSEERARLNYALSQELSRTVSEIDGVVSARVHLATASDEPIARRDSNSSASVAIHHKRDFNTAGFVPRIKILVANAVDGLDYDRVSIALFPTNDAASDWPDSRGIDVKYEFEDPSPQAPQEVTPAGLIGSNINPATAAILAGGLIVLLLAGQAILGGSRRNRAGGMRQGESEGDERRTSGARARRHREK